MPRASVFRAAALVLMIAAGAVRPTFAQQPGRTGVDTLHVGAPVASFEEARAVRLDPAGTIYVVDAGLDAVVRISADGSDRQALGGPGFALGTFDGPADVDPTNGLAIWVADEGNGRVQQFSRRFRFLAALPIPADPARAAGVPRFATDEAAEAPLGDGRPVAVVTGPDRSLYVLEATAGTIQVWSEQLQFRYALGMAGGGGAVYEPSDLTWHRDRLVVLDQRLERGTDTTAREGRAVLRLYDGLGTLAETIEVPTELQVEPLRVVAAGGSRIAVASERRIGLLDPSTSTWEVLVWPGDPITDVTQHGERLWVLTARGLWTWPDGP